MISSLSKALSPCAGGLSCYNRLDMETPKTVSLVVDANNFIAVAAHANPTLRAPDGTPSGGIFAALRMLKGIVHQELVETVDRIYMVYDAGRPAFRTELCPTYKTERDKRRASGDDEFYECYRFQIDASKPVLRRFGAIIVESRGYEADDTIAGIVLHGGLGRTVIVSGDKDLRQLVRKHVRIYLPTPHKIVSRRDVPAGYLLARCMMGDKSDNIPGLGGIGEVHSQRIIDEMGSRPYTPTALIEHMRRNSSDRFAKRVLESESLLRANWRVMNLRHTAEAAYRNATFVHAPNVEKFKATCRRLGFRSILREGNTYFAFPRTLQGHHR